MLQPDTNLLRAVSRFDPAGRTMPGHHEPMTKRVGTSRRTEFIPACRVCLSRIAALLRVPVYRS